MMNPTSVRDAVEALLRTDIDVAERDELTEAVATVSRLRAWLDARELECVRRSRTLADEGRCEPPESMINTVGRNSSKQANTVVQRSRITEEAPEFAAALADGDVSTGHLDAMNWATRSLTDDQRAEFMANSADLLDAARRQRVDTFERECRDLARFVVAAGNRGSDADELTAQRKAVKVARWTDKSTGMRHTHLELDPVRDATLWTAIDAQLRTLRQQDGNSGTPWNELQADAVVAAVGAGPQGDRVPEIGVFIDHDTAVHGLHDHGICELDDGTPLPVSTVRRLCCDAKIFPVVLGADGEVLDVGRTVRTLNRAQRRALKSMHRTCIHPECTVQFSDCEIHHVIWWRLLGRTDIDNLVPLCTRHHHLVHEGGWTLTLGTGRVATWTRPDGVIHHVGPTTDRAPHGVGATAVRSS
jgi:hypothetical protein